MERNRMTGRNLPAATVRRIQASPFNVAAQLYETLKPRQRVSSTSNNSLTGTGSHKYRERLLKEYKKFLNVPRTYDEIHLHLSSIGYSVSKQAVQVYLRTHPKDFERTEVRKHNPRGGPSNITAYVRKE